MKHIFSILFLAIMVITASAQSIERQVISTAGDYSTNGNVQVSWTLGEPVIETFSNGNVTLTQGFQQPDNTECGTVQNPMVSNITCTSALYTWSPVEGVDHYVVQGNFSDRPISGGQITIPGTDTSYLETNLIPGNEYHWQVIAYCDAAETEFGEWSSIVVYSSTCDATEGVVAANVGLTTADLTWNFNECATGYLIQGNRASGPITAVELTINDPNQTSRSVTGLDPGTAYHWQVITLCDNSTQSAPSTIDQFTTLSCDAPDPISSTNISANSATLNWQANPLANKYILRGRIQGQSGWVTLDINNASASSRTFTSLQAGTTYEWQIRTRCQGGINSPWSSLDVFTTPNSLAKNNSDDWMSDKESLTVYPNPADEKIHLQVSSLSKSGLLVIRDASGKLMFSQRISTLDTHSLNTLEFGSGSYFAQITLEDGSILTQKFIIAH